MNTKSAPKKTARPARKTTRGRPFSFLLDPATEANLKLLIADKPHLDLTGAIREAAHLAARAIESKE